MNPQGKATTNHHCGEDNRWQKTPAVCHRSQHTVVNTLHHYALKNLLTDALRT